MEIKIENGTANIFSPYNPDFVKKIKGIGGAKWSPSNKCWTVPESAVPAVREIMTEVYGHSDLEVNDTITLRLTFEYQVDSLCSDVSLFGKVLSHAYGRDSGARVGDDVAFTAGGATSGGSAKNWRSVVRADSVAVLSNVNRNLYERMSAEDLPDGVTVEVIKSEANRSQLLEEKERLLKRLAEIDKLLQA